MYYSKNMELIELGITLGLTLLFFGLIIIQWIWELTSICICICIWYIYLGACWLYNISKKKPRTALIIVFGMGLGIGIMTKYYNIEEIVNEDMKLINLDIYVKNSTPKNISKIFDF